MNMRFPVVSVTGPLWVLCRVGPPSQRAIPSCGYRVHDWDLS